MSWSVARPSARARRSTVFVHSVANASACRLLAMKSMAGDMTMPMDVLVLRPPRVMSSRGTDRVSGYAHGNDLAHGERRYLVRVVVDLHDSQLVRLGRVRGGGR